MTRTAAPRRTELLLAMELVAMVGQVEGGVRWYTTEEMKVCK